MQSIDTNIMLRLVLEDVPKQLQLATQLIDSSHANELHVADAVLFEMVWILAGQYQMGRATIGRILIGITEIQQINCNRALLGKAVPLYVKHPKLSFIDVCLTVSAELNAATPLLTFDKALARTLSGVKLLS